jgi:hypothetical protein
MNKILFLFLFITLQLSAQTIKVEGIVNDSIAKPLEMANVLAINKETKKMDGYSITNDKGKFVLNLQKNATYSIKVSYIGFQPVEKEITTKESNMILPIVMKAGIELEGVELVQEMPVSIKGDTLVYNADSFKTGTERKLEDVLKKLPGVEVNADGEVEVEGKKVNNLLVDGKKFFDGDTKLGVKNIPSDAIDKIQVLRNYNDVGALKGVENNDDNLALNIKLKSGKKNFWFGDVTVSGGQSDKVDRFLINPKLFYYNPKYSVNLITNFNNIGELPLTAQDYFKFSGGLRNMSRNSGTNFALDTNTLGISLLRNNRASNIDTDFGAFNGTYNVTKKWTLTGFAILSSQKTDINTIRQTNILEANTGQITDRDNSISNINQKNDLGLFKIGSVYKPTSDLQINYDALIKTSNTTEENNQERTTISRGVTLNDKINTQNAQQPITFTQNLSAYFTKGEKHVFAFENQFIHQEEDPFYQANLRFFPFAGFLTGYNPSLTGNNNINQNRFIKTQKLDSKLDYFYATSAKTNLNITLGYTNSFQRFNSSMFQILEGGSINNLTNPRENNNVGYKFTDTYLGVHYKMLLGRFTINPGFKVHQYVMTNDQNFSTFTNTIYRVLPDVYADFQIKRSEKLTYTFAVTNDFTDINRLAEGYILNGFTSLFRGNRMLENAFNQTHSLRYFKYNLFNYENIFANINYTRRTDAIKNNAQFIAANQISTPFNNSNFADETFTAGGSYGRTFYKYYKINGGANINWSKFNNIRTTAPNVQVNEAVESFTQNYRLSTATNFRELPNIEFGYNYIINEYQNNTFYTHRPTVKLDYYFLEAFSFVTDYEYSNYYNDNKTVKNSFDFLNASLAYQKKDSKWEYKIAATNILNTTALNDDSFDQFRTSTSQYFVQPRFVMLSLRYNL